MAVNNVRVNNLCAWPLYFKRATGQGDIEIPASAKNFALLSFEEVLTQIQIGNKMFTGIDGMGNHARIQISDEKQRRELFGMDEADQQETVVVTVESVKELLAIKSKSKFSERLKELVKTNAEKKMLVDLAFQAGAEECEAWKLDALRRISDTAGV